MHRKPDQHAPFEAAPIQRMGFSVRDASRATSLSVSTLYELMAAGQLHYLKFGARRIIPAASLAALMGSK